MASTKEQGTTGGFLSGQPGKASTTQATSTFGTNTTTTTGVSTLPFAGVTALRTAGGYVSGKPTAASTTQMATIFSTSTTSAPKTPAPAPVTFAPAIIEPRERDSNLKDSCFPFPSEIEDDYLDFLGDDWEDE